LRSTWLNYFLLSSVCQLRLGDWCPAIDGECVFDARHPCGSSWWYWKLVTLISNSFLLYYIYLKKYLILYERSLFLFRCCEWRKRKRKIKMHKNC
jgi:hypothetical protein